MIMQASIVYFSTVKRIICFSGSLREQILSFKDKLQHVQNVVGLQEG